MRESEREFGEVNAAGMECVNKSVVGIFKLGKTRSGISTRYSKDFRFRKEISINLAMGSWNKNIDS